MLLNRVEYALMNNPVRAAIQRHFEARRLLRLGGPMQHGRALEIGCGRGVGVEIIVRTLGADSVDAFDLDPRLAKLARARCTQLDLRARVWIGDAVAISVPDESYDAVVDFGILHHVPEWRLALAELHRVLRPGGRLYAEEVLGPFLDHPLTRRFLEHPRKDRFDAEGFGRELERAGFQSIASEQLWGCFAWFTARK